MRILLVEDEKNLSAAVCRLLEKQRFVVDPAYTGPDGLDYALSGNYDAIILDVMLPGMDGFTILEQIRAEGVKTPVMMLTARGDLQDRVRGLQGGADYYLPKPFQMEELVACLRAITRRGDRAPLMALAYGGISLSERDAKLQNDATGQSVKLGAKEYQLMELFLRNPAQILPKETLIERVWGYDYIGETNVVDVYIRYLRGKIDDAFGTKLIQTVRGVGYVLRE
jgi:DNA-binding response OmpR family regulator